MGNLIWLGGVLTTLFLVVLSVKARRWWPLAYVFALLLGMGTGVLTWEWPEFLRQCWWLLGLCYFFYLPLWKSVQRRHRAVYGE